MVYDAEKDYSAHWERNRRPCEKCTEYRPDSRQVNRCWNYLKVQAAGGVQLDFRAHDVLRKKGGTWRGKRKTYWPFDYDPSLILNGCPAMVPKEPYCAYCAQLFHMDNSSPEQDCQVCGKPGNACENCGPVGDEETQWVHRCEMKLRLCDHCYELLDNILDEQRKTQRQEKVAQGDEIECANCEDFYPPDVMTLVDNTTWLCEHCVDEAGFQRKGGMYLLVTNRGQELWLKNPADWKVATIWPWIFPFPQPWKAEQWDPPINSQVILAWQGRRAMEPHPCQGCEFKKGMGNKAKGKKLGYPPGGKCTRPEGLCENFIPEKSGCDRLKGESQTQEADA